MTWLDYAEDNHIRDSLTPTSPSENTLHSMQQKATRLLPAIGVVLILAVLIVITILIFLLFVFFLFLLVFSSPHAPLPCLSCMDPSPSMLLQYVMVYNKRL